jgi:hypothetical protein
MPTTAFDPYVKLAQSNIASLTDFWMSPELLWAPLQGLQRAFVPGAETQAPTVPTEAMSRLFKAFLENYTRFVSELTQTGFSWVSEGQRAAGEAANQVIEASAPVRKAASGS